MTISELLKIFSIIAIIIFSGYAISVVVDKDRECKKQGGIAARTITGYECVMPMNKKDKS